jgi:osmotically-inducible protein OsmY
MNKDNELKDLVLEELAWEPSVTPAHIGVSVHGGVVTLNGHVNNFAQKRAAETAAWRVKGVKAVAEEMEVRLPSQYTYGDEEIAATAIAQLKWNALVPKDAVKITVQKGFITLTGQVDWHFQAEAATDALRTLWGVTGITNEMTVKTRVDAGNVGDQIRRALHRSWFEPENVKVSADGGNITLTGTVKSSNDRYLAASTAWAAPGATSVMNEIRVSS